MFFLSGQSQLKKESWWWIDIIFRCVCPLGEWPVLKVKCDTAFANFTFLLWASFKDSKKRNKLSTYGCAANTTSAWAVCHSWEFLGVLSNKLGVLLAGSWNLGVALSLTANRMTAYLGFVDWITTALQATSLREPSHHSMLTNITTKTKQKLLSMQYKTTQLGMIWEPE